MTGPGGPFPSSLILSPDEREFQTAKKMANGTGAGRFKIATPVVPEGTAGARGRAAIVAAGDDPEPFRVGATINRVNASSQPFAGDGDHHNDISGDTSIAGMSPTGFSMKPLIFTVLDGGPSLPSIPTITETATSSELELLATDTAVGPDTGLHSYRICAHLGPTITNTAYGLVFHPGTTATMRLGWEHWYVTINDGIELRRPIQVGRGVFGDTITWPSLDLYDSKFVFGWNVGVDSGFVSQMHDAVAGFWDWLGGAWLRYDASTSSLFLPDFEDSNTFFAGNAAGVWYPPDAPTPTNTLPAGTMGYMALDFSGGWSS